MGWHVIRSFKRMCPIVRILWRYPVEPCLKVIPYISAGILIQSQPRTCVKDLDVEKTDCQ